jgi:hypothetical protein
MSPSTVIAQFYVDVLPVEQRLSWLPPLQQTFAAWHTAGATEAVHLLDRREVLLSTATLSSASLRLLYESLSQHIQVLHPLKPLSAWHTRPLHERIAFHAASHSAAQTQAVLPPGALATRNWNASTCAACGGTCAGSPATRSQALYHQSIDLRPCRGIWDAARDGFTLCLSSAENTGGCGGAHALAQVVGRARTRGRRFTVALGKPALTPALSERYCVLLCQARLSVCTAHRVRRRGKQ